MRKGRTSSRRGLLGLALGSALLVGASGVLTGCLSPTIPLPPPSRPEISPPNASGISTISGVVPARSTAFAENLATGRIAGQVTDDTGEYSVQLAAQIDDIIIVWYQQGMDESQSVEANVPETSTQLPPIPLGGAPGE